MVLIRNGEWPKGQKRKFGGHYYGLLAVYSTKTEAIDRTKTKHSVDLLRNLYRITQAKEGYRVWYRNIMHKGRK